MAILNLGRVRGEDGFTPIIAVEEDTLLAYRLRIVTGSNTFITPNLARGIEYPIGWSYTQKFNDPTPIERGLPGEWKPWTHRADGYRLTSAALPAFTTYSPGTNYAANAYVMWHLQGAGYELWKAKAAITAAAAQLDPVLWEKYESGDIIERRHLQGWLDDDWAIGHVVESGDYAGKRVCEMICLGGTFPSFEGGNRPTFVNGGIQRGRIVNIPGSFNALSRTYDEGGATGAFSGSRYNNGDIYGSGGIGNANYIYLNPSRVVLTGADVAGTNISERHWRRVA